MKRPLLALLLAAFSCSALAETFEDQLKVFQKTVSATLAKSSTTPGDRANERAMYSASQLAALSTNPSLFAGSPQEFERQIVALVAMTQNDPEVTKAADALIAAFKAERQARSDRARTEVDALLAKAGAACLAAKVPADIDATLLALAPYSRNSGYERRASEDQESWQRGANAYRFVARWQDYLAARARSNRDELRGVLQELANSVDVAMMPRSSILALIPPSGSSQPAVSDGELLAGITASLEKARTYDDFLAVARAVAAVSRTNSGLSVNNLQSVLNNLLDDRQQVLSGTRSHSVFSDGGLRQLSAQDPVNTEGTRAALLAFRRDTQLRALQLSFTGVKLPAPEASENPEVYLLRILAQFAERAEWLQLREGLDFYRQNFSGGRSAAWLTADMDSINAYLGGRNLERAEQYGSAISGYRRALRSVGRFFPAEVISARLAELKKTHPAAFEDADREEAARTRAGVTMPARMPVGAMPIMPDGVRPPAPSGPRGQETPSADPSKSAPSANP